MKFFPMFPPPESKYGDAPGKKLRYKFTLYFVAVVGRSLLTRELVTLAYFRCVYADHLSLESSREESACVGDRLTPPTDWRSRQD